MFQKCEPPALNQKSFTMAGISAVPGELHEGGFEVTVDDALENRVRFQRHDVDGDAHLSEILAHHRGTPFEHGVAAENEHCEARLVAAFVFEPFVCIAIDQPEAFEQAFCLLT